MPYRELNPDGLIEILNQLHLRLVQYFPNATLTKVMEEVQQVAAKAKIENARGQRRLYSAVIAQISFIAGVIALGVWISSHVRGDESVGLIEMFQGLEAAINIAIFLAVGLGFIFTLETRIRRRHILAAIDELRSLAHVIDLHQIRKDPERIASASDSTRGESNYSPLELVRYLDYASDMLSVVSKLAALYGKGSVDGVVLEAVNSVEHLTSSTSQKIWQKISIALDLHQLPGKSAA